ncbi:MAG: hypothetical protein HWD59_03935 [Coxiellaceae bacterium]|nr:MAG: hypothetical protein HWD59_03935 [Coxiellaceae bacterium]
MPGNKRKSNSSSDGSTKKQQIAAAITQNSAVFSIGNNNTTLVEKFDPKIIEKTFNFSTQRRFRRNHSGNFTGR